MRPRRSGDRASADPPRRRAPTRRPQPTLAEVGEFGFLSAILPSIPWGPSVRLGPGDDAAVVTPPAGDLVYTTDALVEGSHFQRTWLTPYELGRKAFAVNASDVAAMGAQPLWCVASLAVPETTAQADLAALVRGVRDAANEQGADLVGGNLARSPLWFVSLTLTGVLPAAPLLRSGAAVGDRIYVSGTLGDAALAVAGWTSDPPLPPTGGLRRRFVAPQARVDVGLALARGKLASAAIDVSDGLVQDLGHLCLASGVAARVEVARLPVSARLRRSLAAFPHLALRGGEDYELLFTVPRTAERRLATVARKTGCGLHCIGEIVAGSGVHVVDADGRELALGPGGHDHFAPGTVGRKRRKT